MENNQLNKREAKLSFVAINSRKELYKTALIIDDSKVNQHLLGNILQPMGYKIFFAENGEQGIKEFKSIKPSITFLDIVMPKKQGLEVLQEIKLIDANAVVVMVSSFSSKENIHKSKYLNADWFLKKPISKQQIIDILQRFEKRIK